VLFRSALEGSYSPVLLSYKGQHAIAHRCPVGWSYSLINVSDDGKHETGCTMFVGTKEAAVNSAAFHIIQNACDVFAIRSDSDLPTWLTDRSKRSDLVSWCRWQRAAAYAQKNNEPDVHKWACDHHYEARFA